MKQKVLGKFIAGTLTAMILLGGCGEQEAGSSGGSIKDEKQDAAKISGVHVADGAKYQYQPVNLKDIIVEYSGLKGDKPLSEYDGEYLLDSDVYLGDTVGLYLDGEHYDAEVGEYLPYTDIVWEVINNSEFWDVTDYDAKEIDPKLFRGVVEYSDGSRYEVTPERVRGNGVSEAMRFYVSISYCGVDYEGSVVCGDPDGEYLGEGEEPDYTGTVEVRVSESSQGEAEEVPTEESETVTSDEGVKQEDRIVIGEVTYADELVDYLLICKGFANMGFTKENIGISVEQRGDKVYVNDVLIEDTDRYFYNLMEINEYLDGIAQNHAYGSYSSSYTEITREDAISMGKFSVSGLDFDIKTGIPCEVYPVLRWTVGGLDYTERIPISVDILESVFPPLPSEWAVYVDEYKYDYSYVYTSWLINIYLYEESKEYPDSHTDVREDGSSTVAQSSGGQPGVITYEQYVQLAQLATAQ